MSPASPRALRQRLAATAALLLLSGCASAPPVPLRLHRLPLESAVAVPASERRATAEVWQLMLPVKLPDHLDRDAMLWPEGGATLVVSATRRWAEPLREAVPRLLRHDLGARWGEDRVWTQPLPAGLVVTRQLRVEILRFETAVDGGAVLLDARCTASDPLGRAAPRVGTMALRVPVRGGGDAGDAIALAHREALGRLASAIVGWGAEGVVGGSRS